MNPFSEANIAKALARIPTMSSDDLRALKERAIGKGIVELSAACDRELALRGNVKMDSQQAQQHAKWSQRSEGQTLADVIHTAFGTFPPSPDELFLIRAIAGNAGISHTELVTLRKKDGVSLLLGHLIYERLGFFRHLIVQGELISNLILIRDDSRSSVRYSLRSEAVQAFTHLHLI